MKRACRAQRSEDMCHQQEIRGIPGQDRDQSLHEITHSDLDTTKLFNKQPRNGHSRPPRNPPSRLLLTSFQMLEPSTSVQYVKGIGPRLAEVLADKGIHTVDDLLHYLPFRYEDRVNPRGIAELRAGEMATVIAEVRNSGLFRTRRMPIFQMTAGQGRTRLKCIWFNATYLRDRFKPGQMVALYGKVEEDHRSGELQLVQPQFEILGELATTALDAASKRPRRRSRSGALCPFMSPRAGPADLALVSPRHPYRAGRSSAGTAGSDPGRGAAASQPDLAARSARAGSLARCRREPARLAVLAHPGAHPADF